MGRKVRKGTKTRVHNISAPMQRQSQSYFEKILSFDFYFQLLGDRPELKPLMYIK